MSNNSKKVKYMLIEYASEHFAFKDQNNIPHLMICEGENQTILDVKSDEFYEWLMAKNFNEKSGDDYKIPSKQSVQDARDVIYSQIKYQPGISKYNLYIRFAPDPLKNGITYIDMANAKGEVIEVTDKSWQVIKPDFPIFRKIHHQKELPDTLRLFPGTDHVDDEELLGYFFNWLPVKDEGEKLLLLSYMLYIISTERPKPILCFKGPKGSGKSTAASLIKQLLDPSQLERMMIGSLDDLALSLTQNGVVLLDNVDRFNNKQSNMLCIASTGGGFLRRVLYSNDSMSAYAFKGAIVMSGISTPSQKTDLLERLLQIELAPLNEKNRLTEEDIYQNFEMYRPNILAMLLDKLVKVKSQEIGFKVHKKQRLADFCYVGEKTAVAFGYKQEDFANAYEANAKAGLSEVFENPIFQIIHKIIDLEGDFQGTVTDLRKKMQFNQNWTDLLREEKMNANKLGVFLSTHYHAFLDKGILIENVGSRKNGRIKKISKLENYSSPLSPEEKTEGDNGDNSFDDSDYDF